MEMNQSPKPPYDDAERRAMEQQILTAAELIRHGARVNELGELTLTGVQLERVQQTGDALAQTGLVDYDESLADSGFEEIEALEEWLDTAIKITGEENTDTLVTLKRRTLHALRKKGIYTVRDIYILGREVTDDIRNLGGGAIDEIAALFAASSPHAIPWQEKPTVAQIVALSGGLNRVPSYVLQIRGDIVDHKAPSSLYNDRRSVQEVLDMQIRPRVSSWETDESKLHAQQQMLQTQQAAREFAARYQEAIARAGEL